MLKKMLSSFALGAAICLSTFTFAVALPTICEWSANGCNHVAWDNDGDGIGGLWSDCGYPPGWVFIGYGSMGNCPE